MTIKALYPTVRPTLNLNFARTKALDPRVTFTRASTATFVGSNGLIQTAASGAARFDHNPETGESLGLLVEASRTNVVTNSTNPTWSNINAGTGVVPVVTAVSDAAPDGTTNSVQRFQFDRGAGNASGDYSLSFIGSTVASALYSDTLWLKSNDANSYTAILYDPNGVIGKEIVVTPTWQRFALDGSTNYKNSNHTATTNPLILFGLRNDPAGGIFAIGNTNSQTADILAWGAQIEAGAFPTSYIPTSGATVTRAADVASMTGTNFSSWYNNNQGTYFLNAVTLNGSTATNTTQDNLIDDGYVFIQDYVGASVRRRVIGSASGAFNFNPAQAPSRRVAVAFDSSSANVAYNGILQSVDTTVSGLPNTASSLRIGATITSAALVDQGTIARLAFYPVRLPDAQLQALTS